MISDASSKKCLMDLAVWKDTEPMGKLGHFISDVQGNQPRREVMF
jgi:hypothetical protein